MSTQNRGRQLDMLHGSIWNRLPQFALSVAATAILEQLFNASDIAIVGNFTGAERTVAVVAVGTNSPVIGLIVNLFIGIALGSNVIIAHAVGQTFQTIMTTYPISLAATALMIFIALLWYRPSKRFAAAGSGIS